MVKGIVFGKGFLGSRIADEFGCELIGREADPLNLKVLRDFLDREKPEVVINAIGKTGRPNIDWCEDNKEETILSNIVAAINLCTECNKRNIYFVHLSSGCIYEGDNDGKGFSEEDGPNFEGSFYSKSKILAEKILKEFPCLIVRLRMPIDNRPHDRNLINKLRNYDRVIDVKNSMTCVPNMIGVLRNLISQRRVGIYNVVNPGVISAAEILKMYQEIVYSGCEFEIMSLSELDAITKAKRSNCVLNTDKLIKEGIEMPEIHQAIKECLLNYRRHIQ